MPACRRAQYSQLKAGPPGTVFFLEAPRDAGARGNTLHRFRLSDRKAELFQTNVADYAVSADGKKLVYRTRRRRRPGAAAARRRRGRSCSSSMPTRRRRRPAQGRLDVTLRMHLDPKAEFTQIFNEGWRLQRDYLYVPNMHGANWPRMKEMYGAMLPHVAHRADLNYLLDNMGAEIAIGHSYVRGGAMPEVPANPGGLLGADFAIESGRYKIAKIYDGESWNPELRAPLAGPGINVAVGDFILAINGVDLAAPDSIYRLLDGTANRQTVLTVNDAARHAGRAAGHRRAGRQRPGPAHARVGRRESPLRRQAIERPARLRLRAEHRAGRLRRASTATTSRSRTSRAR